MFRLIQIDPESLAIYINASALARHPKSDRLFDFLDKAGSRGPIFALKSHIEAFGFDLDLLDFASSYLHELRHFSDLLFTPFGFYRIRTAFEFYTNFPFLMWGSSEVIPIPLISASDKINRGLMGLDDTYLVSIMHRTTKTAFSRVRLINSENQYDHSTGEIKIGGDRLLEGLAYITQFEFLFNNYDGIDTRGRLPEFFSDFTGTPFDLAYRWFTPTVHSLHPNEKMPNNRLIQAILFASLCGSIPVLSKVRKQHDPVREITYRDVSDQLPSARFHRLIKYFEQSPRSSLTSDSEAFYLVNRACEDLFGQSLFTEIANDISHTEERIEDSKHHIKERPDGMPQLDPSFAYAQLHKYRKRSFDLFKRNPLLFTSSHNFLELSTFLKPSVIYVTPQGVSPREAVPFGAKDRKWVAITSREIDTPADKETFIYSYWGPRRDEIGHHIGLNEVKLDGGGTNITDDTLSSFQVIYGIYAPMYRWMLYVKRYLTMLEVESDGIVECLGLEKGRFRIDPFYEKTTDVSNSNSFAKFFGINQFTCDVCGKKCEASMGYIVSANTVRQNKKLAGHLTALDPSAAFFLLKKDWSDWFICTSDMAKWNLPIPAG